MQPFGPIGVIRIDLAVMAPVSSAVPFAVTQSLTARSLAAADWVSVYVVEEVTATVTFEVATDVEVVEPFDPLARRPNPDVLTP